MPIFRISSEPRQNTSGVQSQYSKRIKRILALLETAGTIEDMDLPDLKLHELRGDRSGI